MDVFHGYQFQDFVEQQAKRRIDATLLDRAVKAGIITLCGAEFLRNLK
jgi:hypothetical protein